MFKRWNRFPVGATLVLMITLTGCGGDGNTPSEPVFTRLADFLNDRSREGAFETPADPHRGRFLGEVPAELAAELAARLDSTGIVICFFNPDLLGAPRPTFRPRDLSFTSRQSRGFAKPNAPALQAARDLLNVLEGEGVGNLQKFKDALNDHEFHREGYEAGGAHVTEDASAITFLPGITFEDWMVIVVYDGNTHTVLKGGTMDDLLNKHFQENRALTDNMLTVMHELIHVVIYRNGKGSCLGKGADEEACVADLQRVLEYHVRVCKKTKVGEDASVDVASRDFWINSAQQSCGGRACLDLLGLSLP